MENVSLQPYTRDRMVYGPPWLLAGLALAFSMVDATLAAALAPWMFLLSLLVLGMPHGFIDALILLKPQRNGQPFGTRLQLQLLVGYVTLAGAYAVLWQVQSGWAMWLFLALTAWHWGSAEAGSLRGRKGSQLLLALSKGAVIVCSIFAFHHNEAMQATSGFDFAMPPAWARAGWACAIIGFGGLLLWAHRQRPVAALRPLLDTAIVVSLLALTPLFLGLTVFYAGFHSYRHFLWFRQESGRQRPATRSCFEATAANAHLWSAVMMIGLVAAIWFLLRLHPEQIELTTIPLHLQLLAVLTLPHTLFTGWLQCRPHLGMRPMNLLTPESTR